MPMRTIDDAASQDVRVNSKPLGEFTEHAATAIVDYNQLRLPSMSITTHNDL